MIPGLGAAAAPKVTSMRDASAIPNTGAPQPTARPAQPKLIAGLLLPHPIANPVSLYQLVLGDLLVLGVTCGLQSRVLPAWSLPEFSLPVFVVLTTLFAFSEGAYRETPDPFPVGITPGLIRSVAFATLLTFLARWDEARLLSIPLTVASSTAALLLYRQLRQIAWAHRRQDEELRRVLIVGTGPGAFAISRALHSDPSHRAVVRGFVADSVSPSPAVLGRIADLDWLARAEFIDEVILALPGQAAQTREAADIALRNHLDVRAVPDLPAGPWPDAKVDYLGGVPVITLHREPVPSAELLLKRWIDIASASAGLLLTGPLMALVALAIRIDSRGPAIYTAERIGAKGRRFRCYKFRSMVTDADNLKDDLRTQNQREGPTFKVAEDPRITRVGRFIRRYSLDELPQLWNVLRGDMSMVGPRPHPVDDVNRYQLHHYRRLDVCPGITGLWQISARNSPSFDLNMHLDLTYIENWSLRLDLRILLSTIRVLFAPEGV